MSSVSEIANRKLWLDSLRGMAMILVVYGHCVSGWTEYFVFTSPIKMPLFFAISGYLFKLRDGNTLEFLKSLFRKIVVPWLVLGLLPFVFIQSPLEVWDRFLGMLSGKIHWFMICLILAECLHFVVHKCLKEEKYLVGLSLMMTTAGYIMHCYGLGKYAMFNTALIVQSFFCLGHLIKVYEAKLSLRASQWLPAVGLGYLTLCVLSLWLFPAQSLDVHLNRYYNLPLCALLIISGVFFTFTLFRLLDIKHSWIVFIGQNTLLIYMLHFGILKLINHYCGFLSAFHIYPISILGLAKSTLAIFICCIIAFAVNRYIPEIVGKQRTKKV